MMRMLARYAWKIAMQGALALAITLPLHAQRTHVLLVVGLSGQPQFKRSFEASAQSARDAAKKEMCNVDILRRCQEAMTIVPIPQRPRSMTRPFDDSRRFAYVCAHFYIN